MNLLLEQNFNPAKMIVKLTVTAAFEAMCRAQVC
jgi:hypothetical protein